MPSGKMRFDSAPGIRSREHDITSTFSRWLGLRGMLNRGYVLASGLYFVVAAHLLASQIVLLGTCMSFTLLLADIPAGVWADSISRKWALVLGQLFLAVAMILTGLVTAFPLLMLTQVLWGLGWAFLNGADVAWLNDELNDPQRIARALAASARWGVTGGATGMIALGLLSWATSLATAIIVAGSAMAMLALFVAAQFTEHNFTPTHTRRWGAAFGIYQRGISLSRSDRQIRLIFVATLLLSGATMVAWLFPKRLINLGFPNDPILWYTAIGILSAALGVVALSIVEARIDDVGTAQRYYALACFMGILGLIVLALVPAAVVGGLGRCTPEWHRGYRDAPDQRDLGEPACHQRCACDGSLVSLSG